MSIKVIFLNACRNAQCKKNDDSCSLQFLLEILDLSMFVSFCVLFGIDNVDEMITKETENIYSCIWLMIVSLAIYDITI